MQIVVGLLANTMLLWAIFGLVNIGLVLLYRSTGVLNFAQGQFLLLGAYLMSTVQPRTGYWLGLVVVAVAVAAVGWLTYQLAMKYMLGSEEFAKVVMSFLVALLLTQIVAILWGTNPRSVTPPANGGLHLGAGLLPWNSAIALIIAAGVVGSVTLFMRRTIPGLRMQALAQDESLAMYSGMRIHRLSAVAWATAGAVAAIAGVAYAQTTAVTFSLSEIGLLAFPAAVLGGLTSLGGSMAGAAVVALVFTVADYRLGGASASVAEYALMLVILLVLPFGLFGRPSTQRL